MRFIFTLTTMAFAIALSACDTLPVETNQQMADRFCAEQGGTRFFNEQNDEGLNYLDIRCKNGKTFLVSY